MLVKPYKRVFFESKQVGTLFHFTSTVKAHHIIEENKLTAVGGQISFTRDPLSFKAFGLGGGKQVLFALDGDLLSERFYIKPHQYSVEGGEFSSKEDYGDETEERVYKNIPNLSKYIKKFFILKENILYEWSRNEKERIKVQNVFKLNWKNKFIEDFEEVVSFFKNKLGNKVVVVEKEKGINYKRI